MPSINFFNQEHNYALKNKRVVKNWLKELIKKENCSLETINFIFTSDEDLLKINNEYLKHDTYTDIITFDYSEEKNLEGDIYISVDRVLENAGTLKVAFESELSRVLAHGVLHLAGYKDKTGAEKSLMRNKEDQYLKLLQTFHVEH